MHFEVVKVVLQHLHCSQCWKHVFQNPYDDDGNDGDDESFHYKLSFSLKVGGAEAGNNVQDLLSRRNCKASMSS